SSRRRHTSWPRDWSSDVCSSDLLRLTQLVEELLLLARADASVDTPLLASEVEAVPEESAHREPPVELDHAVLQMVRQLRRRLSRSEERRVGKEWRAGGAGED